MIFVSINPWKDQTLSAFIDANFCIRLAPLPALDDVSIIERVHPGCVFSEAVRFETEGRIPLDAVYCIVEDYFMQFGYFVDITRKTDVLYSGWIVHEEEMNSHVAIYYEVDMNKKPKDIICISVFPDTRP